MKTKKWIVYGATGVVGLGLIAGGATAAAAAMDLRDAEGATLPGGQLTGKAPSTFDSSTPVRMQVTEDDATVVSAPSPTPAASPQPAPSPATPATPATPASPVTPVTPPSPVTPPTPASAVSAASN